MRIGAKNDQISFFLLYICQSIVWKTARSTLNPDEINLSNLIIECHAIKITLDAFESPGRFTYGAL